MASMLSPLVLALLGLAAGKALVADPAFAVPARAAQAALAQSRLHAAIDAPLDPEALKMGMKQTLMHSIVIGQVQYNNAIRASFSQTPLDSPEMRLLASDLGPFLVEQGCKRLGDERLAGKDAQVFAASGDLGRGEVRFKLWVDKASGLPLRATSDEPESDVDVLLDAGWRKGKPGSSPKAPANAKRVVATHAYLFGEAVKPPGPKGAVDGAALSTLQTLLKGTP
jgi:hypothetical protein